MKVVADGSRPQLPSVIAGHHTWNSVSASHSDSELVQSVACKKLSQALDPELFCTSQN